MVTFGARRVRALSLLKAVAAVASSLRPRRRRAACAVAAALLVAVAPAAHAQGSGAVTRGLSVAVPRVAARLTARDIGLVVNTADPYSVEVGAHYAAVRRLSPEQILRVELPMRAELTPVELRHLAERIDAHFGPATQALALAWTLPYAVGCNSITGALAFGYDAELCRQTCAPSRPSPYFNSASARPYTDFGFRPAMLLAAPEAAAAKALIDRGAAADRTLGLRGAPPANAWFVATRDTRRSVRAVLFPPLGYVASLGIDVHVAQADALDAPERVVLYLTGATQVERLDRVQWLPGALADHLTSFGGALDALTGQMTALSWIASGATASYGTTSEPCAHLQKFPHPQVLLLTYAQGATALEAYWKSVAWPQQGLFIGEPLAAPFARR